MQKLGNDPVVMQSEKRGQGPQKMNITQKWVNPFFFFFSGRLAAH